MIQNPIEKKIEIHGCFTDLNERLQISALADMFNYLALEHCEGTPIAIKNLFANNLSWVLFSIKFDIERLPIMDETVTIRTQFVNVDRIICNRDFVVIDEQQNVIVRATSQWLLINLTKRRPVKPLPILYQLQEEAKNKPRLFDDVAPKLQEAKHYDTITDFKTLYSEVDFNNHITSSCYYKWIINSMPISFLERYTLVKIDANFIKEVRYGNFIDSHYHIDSSNSQRPTTYHKITTSNDTLHFLAEIIWKEH